MRLTIKVGRCLDNSDIQCFRNQQKRLKDKIQGRDSLIAEITQSTVSLLIQNGIHPKYNIISSQWEKFCDLALLTCLHRWSLESKTNHISERACILILYGIWTRVLYHVNETYLSSIFLTKSINPNINWKLGILKMWIKMISGPLFSFKENTLALLGYLHTSSQFILHMHL